MRLLVTGATGFTGTALLRFLSNKSDVQITAVTRNAFRTTPDNGASWVTADLLDKKELCRLLTIVRPDAVIHLAGLNRGSPEELFLANVFVLRNLLDAIAVTCPSCRILVTSSSAVYGYQGPDPITEDSPFQPVAEYGSSKAAGDLLATMYHREKELSIAIARPFNLAGPGQPDVFICGKIIRQFVECERGLRNAISLLEARSCRDFVDVRDVVRAYWSIIAHPQFAECCTGRAFNISSGKACPISEIIATLERITDKTYPVTLAHDSPTVAIPSQQGDSSRIFRITGWKPEISLEQTLRDMLDAERDAGAQF